MIEWQWLPFDDIPAGDWYEVLRQRQQVFILEQTCLYPDIDGLDPHCHHLMAWRTADGQRVLQASLRVLPPGLKRLPNCPLRHPNPMTPQIGPLRMKDLHYNSIQCTACIMTQNSTAIILFLCRTGGEGVAKSQFLVYPPPFQSPKIFH